MATTIRNKLLSNAQKALEKGNLTRAIKHYNKLLDLNPDDVRVRLRIGDLQARLGKRRDAIETYEQVAEEYYYQGFYLKSVAVLKQILRLDPNRTDIQVKLAELYQQLNLVSDGMAQYRAVAEAFRERGDTERNLEVLARIAEIDPDDINTHITMGEQLAQLGRLDEATGSFAKASDRLYQAGRFNEFIKVTERYLFHRGNDLERLKRLIEVYLERDDAKRALAKLQLLFKSDPKDIEGLSLLAKAFLAINKPAKAAKVLNELADVYVAEGQEEFAIDTYRRVVEIDPGNVEACSHLGIAPSSGVQEQFIPVEPLTGETKVPASAVVANAAIMPDRPNEWRHVRPASGLYQMGSGLMTCSEGLTTELEEEVNRLLIEIDGYTKVGLNDHAFATVKQALQIDPNNITVRERAAHLALRLSLVNKAIDSLLVLAKLCWKPDPVRGASYLHHAVRIDPENPEVMQLRADLGLANADLEQFIVEKSEQEIDIVEVEEQPDEAVAVEQPARFDAGDVAAPVTAESFDRKETVVADSPYERLGQAAAWTSPLSMTDGAPVDAGPSSKVEVSLDAAGPTEPTVAEAVPVQTPPTQEPAATGQSSDDWVPFAPVNENSELMHLTASDDTTDAISRAAAELERQLAMQDESPFDGAAHRSGMHVIAVPDEDDEDLDDLFLDPDEDELDEDAPPAQEPTPQAAETSIGGFELGGELAAVLSELSRSVTDGGDVKAQSAEPTTATGVTPPQQAPTMTLGNDPVTPTPKALQQPLDELRRSFQADMPLKPAEPPVPQAPEELEPLPPLPPSISLEESIEQLVEDLQPLEERLADVLAEMGTPGMLPAVPPAEPPQEPVAQPVESPPKPVASAPDAVVAETPAPPAETEAQGVSDSDEPAELDLPPLPPDLPRGLSEDIRELEFFSAAGLHDEAQSLLFEITANFPGHAEMVMDRMEEIREQLAVRELSS